MNPIRPRIIPGITFAREWIWLVQARKLEIMFSCREVTALADAFVDGELLSIVRARVVRHLLVCRACAALIEEKAELKRLVRASARALTAPVALWQNVRHRIGA